MSERTEQQLVTLRKAISGPALAAIRHHCDDSVVRAVEAAMGITESNDSRPEDGLPTSLDSFEVFRDGREHGLQPTSHWNYDVDDAADSKRLDELPPEEQARVRAALDAKRIVREERLVYSGDIVCPECGHVDDGERPFHKCRGCNLRYCQRCFWDSHEGDRCNACVKARQDGFGTCPDCDGDTVLAQGGRYECRSCDWWSAEPAPEGTLEPSWRVTLDD